MSDGVAILHFNLHREYLAKIDVVAAAARELHRVRAEALPKVKGGLRASAPARNSHCGSRPRAFRRRAGLNRELARANLDFVAQQLAQRFDGKILVLHPAYAGEQFAGQD